MKIGGYLVPATEQDAETLKQFKTGEGVTVKISRKRNIDFHRKFFAMLNLGFDAWEPDMPVYKDQPATKNFEKFREDITILAGHYEAVTNIKGAVQLKARSISFGNMDEFEFSRVYYSVADVLIKHVLHNYTREDIDRVVENLVKFTEV